MSVAFETVIGLEVHVELKTKTKIFCGCSTAFGAPPNTQCCPSCTGFPGTLPVLNEQVVHLAIVAGLAVDCQITKLSRQDRKNYFYPDLPAAYQISQFDLPLCTDGHLTVEAGGAPRRIGITRIHIEEDAGKLIHTPEGTLVDYNRCGMPLIEIVSEPDLRSADEAVEYLKKLRAALRAAGVSDCRMNEGAFRCDVNLSVRPVGEQKLGTRAEIKNLNSFQSVSRAIEYETTRQIEAVRAGEPLVQETRRFDMATGATYSMRTKENADDYRYFPNADLPMISVSDALIESLRAQMPVMPEARRALFVQRYGLTGYDAGQLTAEAMIADYYERALAAGGSPKSVANMMLSEIFRLLPAEETEIPIPAEHLAALCGMAERGEINSNTAKQVIGIMWAEGGHPAEIVEREGLRQMDDAGELLGFVRAVIGENPKMVESYRAGKTKVIMALVGQTMGKTGGKGNPVLIRELLTAELGAGE